MALTSAVLDSAESGWQIGEEMFVLLSQSNGGNVCSLFSRMK